MNLNCKPTVPLIYMYIPFVIITTYSPRQSYRTEGDLPQDRGKAMHC